MTAAALVSGAAAMVAPHRIAQIQIARIGGRTDHRTANRANGRAQGGITGSSTNGSTAGRAEQSTARCAITSIGAATGEHQCRRKTYYHCRAHVWLPDQL
jgi:hypothetical protein